MKLAFALLVASALCDVRHMKPRDDWCAATMAAFFGYFVLAFIIALSRYWPF